MNRNELIDSEIERDIQDLLAVTPSAELVPAIRRRVANESAQARWHFGRTFALAATLLAALAAGVVFTRSVPTPIDRKPQALRVVDETPGRAAAIAPHVAPSLPTVHRPRRGSVLTPQKSAEPEVLVSQGEAAALRRWLADIGAGRVDLSAVNLPTSTEELSELTGMHPLVPLTIQEGALQ